MEKSNSKTKDRRVEYRERLDKIYMSLYQVILSSPHLMPVVDFKGRWALRRVIIRSSVKPLEYLVSKKGSYLIAKTIIEHQGTSNKPIEIPIYMNPFSWSRP